MTLINFIAILFDIRRDSKCSGNCMTCANLRKYDREECREFAAANGYGERFRRPMVKGCKYDKNGAAVGSVIHN